MRQYQRQLERAPAGHNHTMTMRKKFRSESVEPADYIGDGPVLSNNVTISVGVLCTHMRNALHQRSGRSF